VVLETAPVLTALDIFVDRRVSALPVLNESGTCTQGKRPGWENMGEGCRSLWGNRLGDQGGLGLEASACFDAWAIYLVSLCLSVLFCETGILMTSIFLTSPEDL
jgi:CBS domain-containing protein